MMMMMMMMNIILVKDKFRRFRYGRSVIRPNYASPMRKYIRVRQLSEEGGSGMVDDLREELLMSVKTSEESDEVGGAC